MRFTLFALASTFAIAANAATLNPRASVEVQSCVNDLTSLQNQLKTTANAVNTYLSAAGSEGAVSVLNSEQALINAVDGASASCCTIHSAVFADEAASLISVAQVLAVDVESALNAMIAKKAEFDAVESTTPAVKADLQKLQPKVNALTGCILTAMPESRHNDVSEYIAKINSAFSDVNTAFEN
ncbi:Putative STE/STE20/PAKA protein kinase [Rhizopus microsporus]|nr:Putative STE/STE20/PAKA protein kinase [Rhizopus microsporus]